jgi:Ca2+-binding RTX toxin-like protein
VIPVYWDGTQALTSAWPLPGKVIRDGDSGRTIRGTDGNDTIYGGGGNDTIDDDFGDDVMYGDNGDDTIDGSHGNDRIYGGSGNDRTLGSWGNDVLNGGSGNDGLEGDGDNDTLLGGSGNDWLDGDDGSDVIVGGAGNDRIMTGRGRDVIVFKATLNASVNVDEIYDYSPLADTIRLENSYFRQLTKTGTLSASAFRVGLQALDRSDRIIYDNTTGALSYDPDGIGPAATIQFAKLANLPTLKYSEFVVV